MVMACLQPVPSLSEACEAPVVGYFQIIKSRRLLRRVWPGRAGGNHLETAKTPSFIYLLDNELPDMVGVRIGDDRVRFCLYRLQVIPRKAGGAYQSQNSNNNIL